MAWDRCTSGLRFGDDRVDLGRRADVVRCRDAAPTAAVVDAAVVGEAARSQSATIIPPAWKNTTSSSSSGACRPAERLVERPRARKVADAERDEAETLLHAGSLGRAGGERGNDLAEDARVSRDRLRAAPVPVPLRRPQAAAPPRSRAPRRSRRRRARRRRSGRAARARRRKPATAAVFLRHSRYPEGHAHGRGEEGPCLQAMERGEAGRKSPVTSRY